jgi:predicted enzyme related to lactoylglutathione lyase
MAFGRLSRVAFHVDDIAGVTEDFRRVFGMELEIHDRAVESFGLRATVGQDGIELVQGIDDSGEPIVGEGTRFDLIVVEVDDLEEAHRRVTEAGATLQWSVVTDTGFRELSYGSTFHGIPLVVVQKDETHLLTTPATGPFERVMESPTVPPPRRAATADR